MHKNPKSACHMPEPITNRENARCFQMNSNQASRTCEISDLDSQHNNRLYFPHAHVETLQYTLWHFDNDHSLWGVHGQTCNGLPVR